MKPENNTGEKKVPTQQEQIQALKALMPLKRLQVELQNLNTTFAELKVREHEAVSKLQQFEQAQVEAQRAQEQFQMDNIVKHTVTQEDIDLNPEMVEAGIKVGQEVGIPKEIYANLNLANKVDIKDEDTSQMKEDASSEKETELNEVREEVKSNLSVVKD